MRINAAEVGEDRLADFGLLESAVLRPQTTVNGADAYADVHSKAAALFHSLVKNHAFLDGNKRTGTIAVVLFYAMNGWTFETDDGDVVALALEVAEGPITVDELAGELKRRVSPIEYPPDDSVVLEGE